jgi:hypothetical protein
MLVIVPEKAPSTSTQVSADERGRFPVQAEWITQSTLINVGLIALAIYLVSTLIGVNATDVPSRIALVALVISMPLLAILSLITELQRARRYASYPWYMVVAQGLAQGTAVLGFGAALWHVYYPASIALVLSGTLGLFVYQAYYRRLERDNKPERRGRRG